MNFYQETFFNRRNWILENTARLQLTPIEAMTILSIDFNNEFHRENAPSFLAKQINISEKELDEVLANLNKKGFLTIKTSRSKILFDIDGIFQDKPVPVTLSSDLFELFESEFGRPLSQKETVTLAEWMRLYDVETITNGLREAVIAKKTSFAYIDKILCKDNSNER